MSQTQVPNGPNSEKFLKTYGFGIIPVIGQKAIVATFRKLTYCFVAAGLLAVVLAQIPGTEVMLTIALTCISSSLRLVCDDIISWLASCKKGVTYESDLNWTNVLCTLCGGCVVCYVYLYRIEDSGITAEHTLQVFIGMIFGAMVLNLIMSNQSNTTDKEYGPGIDLAFHYFDRVQRILGEIKNNRRLHQLRLFSKKFFIMLPLNCNVKHKLQKHDDIPIEIEDTMYSIKTYKIGGWIVMLDFPSELTSIRNMAIHKPFPGLDKTGMEKQVRLFYRQLKQLLEGSNEIDENQTRWELIAFDHDELNSTEWSGLEGFLKNVVLPFFDPGSNDGSHPRDDDDDDDDDNDDDNYGSCGNGCNRNHHGGHDHNENSNASVNLGGNERQDGDGINHGNRNGHRIDVRDVATETDQLGEGDFGHDHNENSNASVGQGGNERQDGDGINHGNRNGHRIDVFSEIQMFTIDHLRQRHTGTAQESWDNLLFEPSYHAAL